MQFVFCWYYDTGSFKWCARTGTAKMRGEGKKQTLKHRNWNMTINVNLKTRVAKVAKAQISNVIIVQQRFHFGHNLYQHVTKWWYKTIMCVPRKFKILKKRCNLSKCHSVYAKKVTFALELIALENYPRVFLELSPQTKLKTSGLDNIPFSLIV